ncbi:MULTISPECIES: HNH endonuclease [Helcococcus]|uniref:HNH endonuclease n=1 Tax=Helcococcus bovis TaxID=3153252 RepID=A0ABW9F6L4_9FIRM
MKFSHSTNRLDWINSNLNKIGIEDYRFCLENDCYVCDIEGNFYSVCYRQFSKTGNFIEKYRIKYLKGSIDYDGYRTYRININETKKHLKGHRMMLNAWIGRNDNLVVNHIDGNKSNNRLNNLEWCTVAENNRHAIENNLFNPKKLNYKNRKILDMDLVSIFILNKHCNYSYDSLARMNNCHPKTIKNTL